MTDSINDDILDILAKHAEMEREKVTLSTSLDMIGVDSLKLVEIIFVLEERFDISIPDPDNVGQQNKQFQNAGDVVRVVKELIEEQKPS